MFAARGIRRPVSHLRIVEASLPTAAPISANESPASMRILRATPAEIRRLQRVTATKSGVVSIAPIIGRYGRDRPYFGLQSSWGYTKGQVGAPKLGQHFGHALECPRWN